MRAMLADPPALASLPSATPAPDAAHRVLEHVFGYPLSAANSSRSSSTSPPVVTPWC
jgi:hypothetical protein